MLCYFSFFHPASKFLPTTLHLAIPLPHNQPMSNNIHSNILIPNFNKEHKNIKAIKTTKFPLVFFLISITVVCKHSLSKIGETIFLQNPKTLFCSHANLKVKNLLHFDSQNSQKIEIESFFS
jgi:hypothetical protein